MIQGFWYDAVGGLGLSIKRESGSWHCTGTISNKGGFWDVYVNPYQDRGFTVGSYRTLDEAKTALMKRYGVTDIVNEPVRDQVRA